MAKSNGRASMSDLELPEKEDALPQAPVELPSTDFLPEKTLSVEDAHIEPSTGAYVPEIRTKERLVNLGMRIPLRLRELLEEIAADYKTDMTKIVVDLLEINLPKIPRKRSPRREAVATGSSARTVPRA